MPTLALRHDAPNHMLAFGSSGISLRHRKYECSTRIT